MNKDFAVHVGKQDTNEMWVALHPNVGVKPEFYDAMLNGLEIFKLGDGKTNLAGPNPELSDLMIKQQEHNNKKFAEGKSYTSAIIGGAAGGAATFGIMTALIFVAQNRKKRHLGDHSMSSWLPLHGHSQTSSTTISGRSNGSTTISSDAAANCRFFSLAEIKKATKNFDESHVIGVGGFGKKVYKGVIDGDMKVAIKRSNPSSEQGVNEKAVKFYISKFTPPKLTSFRHI
ncbi:hypothetical protein POM88_021731 [Heracleum sosnowskyi]|uniref:Uncharacterized protein n=1 Tax=Heracleum sosnowskyi TaxID=360622 RepID=A0AAD8IFF4_9APIA|nr:hypothetical protein POM88_021731 [Heracleum sosnowskyi]